MPTISCEEMKNIDSYAINNIGIPSIVLMENAALKVVRNIDLHNMDRITIICGVGNNGGDGLAVARQLALRNKHIDLFIIGNLDKGTKDFNINLNILKNIDICFTHITRYEDLTQLEISLEKNDLTIDSIFGIGITRRVEGLYKEVISLINLKSKKILSVDIPSGLNGDTGEVLGISIKANKTVTFHIIKKGLLENRELAGEIIVEPIGIPKKATNAILNKMD